MSFLRRGTRRRGRVATAATTVGLLAAFQALAIVGAGSAGAVAACTYNPATDTVTITLPVANDAAYIAVESADDLDAESPVGAILFTPSGVYTPDFDPDANSAQCGSATVSNTVQIIVLGSPNGDEFLGIDELEAGLGGGLEPGNFPSTISWFVDMGGGSGDELEWDMDNDLDNELTLSDTAFTFNGAPGEMIGVENVQVFSSSGDDVVDASAAVDLEVNATLGGGDDWFAPGFFSGDTGNGNLDVFIGGGGEDTLSYGTRTTCTVIDNVLGVAGEDANCDGDLLDATDESDSHVGFEVFESGSGNDTLIGSAVSETFIPGDGDDDITADGGYDWIDWSSSTAGMVIDIDGGTATGQGTDTWTDVEAYVGSDFDDTMLVMDDAPGPGVSEFFGGDGVDTVDASGAPFGVWVNLDILDPSGADDLENVVGSAFDDELHGNDLRNMISAGDGNDYLDGQPGNDLLLGGLGNDTYFGDDGADKVSFITSPNAVNVDLSLGFATGEGDDSFDDLIEIIVGSQFDDTITGGPFSGGGTVNFLLVGRGGDDVLTGYIGNDTLKGGGGDDVVRGAAGDDLLKGARGDDRLFGGSGVDVGRGGKGADVCKGVEIKSSCGTPKNPKGPTAARVAP